MEMETALSATTSVPWGIVLRRLTPVASATSRLTAVRWLNSAHVLNATTTPETWRHVAEALDVMALVARLNVEHWKRGLKRVWSSYASQWRVTSIDRAAQFEIGLVIHVEQLEMLMALAERALDVERVRHHHAMARETILAYYMREGEQRVPTNPTRPRIPVRFVLPASLSVETIARALLLTLQIVASQRGPRADTHYGFVASTVADRALFEVTDIELDNRLVLNMKSLQYLDKLAQLGVVIHNIPRINFEANVSQSNADNHDAFGLVETMHRLVAGIGSSFSGVQKLSISSRTAHGHLFPLLTAAQVSKSLRKLTIHIAQGVPEVPGQVDRHLLGFWRCVAYTIFSPHAHHKISRLQLELTNFRAEYVDAIRAVLCTWRPVSAEDFGARMFDRLLGRPSTLLACSKVYLFDPKKQNQDIIPFTLPAPMILRVIEQAVANEDARTVILPGWGRAWVHGRAPVVSANASQSKLTKNIARSFKKINIFNFDEASKPAATILMGLIGRNVEELEVMKSDIVLDGWLKEVFPSLPRLRKLHVVNSRISSLDALLEGLMSSNAKVTCLNLDCALHGDPDEFIRFFAALGDPCHRLSKQLGELHLKVRIQDDILPALRRLSHALCVNRHLHTFRLRFYPAPTQAQLEVMVRELSLHVAAKPICRLAPLSTRRKLAFLSAVTHRGDKTSLAATLQQIDTKMLANIFRFASVGIKRDVQISFASQPAQA